MVVYTFRTFPLVDQLYSLSSDIFVFSKLKKDLITLTKKLELDRPQYVLGIAGTKGFSRIETTTINKFNNGTIVKGRTDELKLFVPSNLPFQPAPRPTRSFCNWTTYQLQTFISENGYHSKLMFIHLNPKDIKELFNYFSKPL